MELLGAAQLCQGHCLRSWVCGQSLDAPDLSNTTSTRCSPMSPTSAPLETDAAIRRSVPSWDLCVAFRSQSVGAGLRSTRSAHTRTSARSTSGIAMEIRRITHCRFCLRPATSGLLLTAAYTWSHSISNVQLDNSSGARDRQNYLDYTGRVSIAETPPSTVRISSWRTHISSCQN